MSNLADTLVTMEAGGGSVILFVMLYLGSNCFNNSKNNTARLKERYTNFTIAWVYLGGKPISTWKPASQYGWLNGCKYRVQFVLSTCNQRSVDLQ